MEFANKGISKKRQLQLYKAMLLPRMIEEKMLLLLRKGQISKWFAGIGQEAIAVGATMAMQQDEYIMPLHRNLGVFTSRNIPLQKLFAQWMGKADGFTKGRDRSFHFGTNEYHIAGMISHLGPQLSVAAGVGLAHKYQNEQKCALAFTGDGGTSEGEFHEALNTAAVWGLPVIFLIENNGYGLSTPINEQFACEQLAHRAKGYGIEGVTINGNNILDVYSTIDKYAKSIRKNPRPILIECMTFRMRGHEEASGVKYVPKHLFETWEKKDPLVNYENWLLQKRVLTNDLIDEFRANNKNEISKALDSAFALPTPKVDLQTELGDVYQKHQVASVAANEGAKSDKRLVDACKDALDQALENWSNLIIMGQDVAEYGGVFKITEGFVQKHGKHRVLNTPICESAIVGIGVGLSLKGIKAVVEMQFSDFVSCAFTQIVNNAAKLHYRWNQNADLVIRMPTGAGVGAGPFHSQSTEAWFAHTPGLKVVYPSNPYDAKGLLLSSIDDPNPVMFFEHKALYRSVSGQIPDGFYTIPIGKAHTVQSGTDISIITYGAGVHWAVEIAKELSTISIEIIDLRTLIPWDKQAVQQTVEKTGKVLVLHEDTQTLGIGSELASWISENVFEYLDGPVKRLGALDTPVPFEQGLEAQYLPKSRLKDALEQLYCY
ncbi:MAG: alpha-ketoacid dehydrogenase subunit alpha/beta [Bacteroidia bacterium]